MLFNLILIFISRESEMMVSDSCKLFQREKYFITTNNFNQFVLRHYKYHIIALVQYKPERCNCENLIAAMHVRTTPKRAPSRLFISALKSNVYRFSRKREKGKVTRYSMRLCTKIELPFFVESIVYLLYWLMYESLCRKCKETT